MVILSALVKRFSVPCLHDNVDSIRIRWEIQCLRYVGFLPYLTKFQPPFSKDFYPSFIYSFFFAQFDINLFTFLTKDWKTKFHLDFMFFDPKIVNNKKYHIITTFFRECRPPWAKDEHIFTTFKRKHFNYIFTKCLPHIKHSFFKFLFTTVQISWLHFTKGWSEFNLIAPHGC